MKDNFYYFKESIRNKEKLDPRYMFLSWSENIDALVETTKEIKELIVTIKQTNLSGGDSKIFYDKLYELTLSENGKKNEFNCFVNACDSTLGTVSKYPETFKMIVDLYIENRGVSEHTPREWIQALIDKGSQRGLGNVGEEKLIELAVEKGFIKVNDFDSFLANDYAVSKYSSEINTAAINKLLGYNINFRSQGKKLDVVLKAKNKFFLIEAKHIKDSGGAQNKQIGELIGLIDTNVPKDVYVVAFMDGIYSNEILDLTDIQVNNSFEIGEHGENKLVSQKIEIVDALHNNDNAFWLNTAGYLKLIEDLIC